jgi:hypothetical protein
MWEYPGWRTQFLETKQKRLRMEPLFRSEFV